MTDDARAAWVALALVLLSTALTGCGSSEEEKVGEAAPLAASRAAGSSESTAVRSTG